MFHRKIACSRSMVITFMASFSLLACSEQPAESTDEILARYEAEGVVRFLAPLDPVTGEPVGEPTRDAYQFLSVEAESRFREEAGFELAADVPSIAPQGSASVWICYGESTHNIGADGQTVEWFFKTTNNSTRIKKQANVHAKVFHPMGSYVTCKDTDSGIENHCSIFLNIASGYNSSTGTHRCCEKKGTFGSYDCTADFGTSDTL